MDNCGVVSTAHFITIDGIEMFEILAQEIHCHLSRLYNLFSAGFIVDASLINIIEVRNDLHYPLTARFLLFTYFLRRCLISIQVQLLIF